MMSEPTPSPPHPDRVKYFKLFISIVVDLIGMATYLIPGLSEGTDVIWAPISGLCCFLLFGGRLGAIGGAFSTAEELLPFTDIIPSLTLVWLMKYVVLPKSSDDEELET